MALSARAQQVLGTLAVVFVGAFLLLAGLDHTELRCDRARGSCTYTAGLLGFERTKEIPLGAIVDHRFDTREGRAGTRGVTVLIDASGREQGLGLTDEASARADYDALHAFFQGQRDAVTVAVGPGWWLVGFGVLCLVFGPFVVRASGPTRARAPVGEQPRRGAGPWRLVLAVGVLALLGLAASTFIARTQGTLALTCTQRCDIGGGSCMPGAQLQLNLAPGEYEVRVFNPDDPAQPIVHRVAVARGEVTHFECAR